MQPNQEKELDQRRKTIEEYIILSHLLTLIAFGLLLLYTLPGLNWETGPFGYNTFFFLILLTGSFIVEKLLRRNIQIAKPQSTSYLLYFALPALFTITILWTGALDRLYLRLFYFAPLLISLVNFGKDFSYYTAGCVAFNLAVLNVYSGRGLISNYDAMLLIFGLWMVWLIGGLIDLEKETQDKIRESSASKMQDVKIEEYKKRIRELRAQRHDFHNQLQVIFTMLQMDKTEECKTYIKKMVTQDADDLQESVPGSLTFDSLIIAKKRKALQQGVRFKTTLNADLTDATIPSHKLAKVLFNLIDNALEALEDEEDGEITVSLNEEEDCYQLEVENNGPPIPLKYRAILFEPGFSTGKDTKGESRGYGLYIIKNIVEDYNGDIKVESNSERTKFICFLPKRESDT